MSDMRWLYPDLEGRCCGLCAHSYTNCSAVLSRLGCWKGHHEPTFLLSRDGTECADFKPAASVDTKDKP